MDWTSSDDDIGGGGSTGGGGGGGGGENSGIRCGHSFPRVTGGGGPGGGGPGGGNGDQHWMSDHGLRGCGEGTNFEQGPTLLQLPSAPAAATANSPVSHSDRREQALVCGQW